MGGPNSADEAKGGDGRDGKDEGGDAEADDEQVKDVPGILTAADGVSRAAKDASRICAGCIEFLRADGLRALKVGGGAEARETE